MALTKTQIQHAGTAAKKAVEAALSSKRQAPKRSAAKNAAGASAFDARQKMGPYDGGTLERVLRAGQTAGILSKADVERYRKKAHAKGIEHADAEGRKLRDALKKDLALHGLRFS